MNYASEDLINEHKGILMGLDILEQMSNQLKENKQVDNADIKEIVNFFKLFAGKCHHGKEEEELFPVLERYGVQKDGGPIGQMLADHAEGKKYISQMSEAISGPLHAKNFTQAAGKYINLFRAHIEKENNILFPLGDKNIPMNIQTMLIESFGEMEEDVMGVGTHYDKLRGLFKNLKDKYLVKN